MAAEYASPGRLKVEHLPELLGRLQHPGADWEHWSIGDLEDWCRVELCVRWMLLERAVANFAALPLLAQAIQKTR